jgi:hypothetical protein
MWPQLIAVTTAGVKLSGAVRERYLASIMVQDQAFFDRVGAGEVVSRSSKDIDSIRIGLGERLGYLIWGSSTIIAVSDSRRAATEYRLTHRHSCLPLSMRQNSQACCSRSYRSR